jgi:hypothetical protein
MSRAMRALLPYVRRSLSAKCEICSAPLGARHAHVVELVTHGVKCACSACAVLFRDGTGRFRTVPDRVEAVSAGGDWSRLEIPVELAFIVRRDGWIAFFPSPAGPVESPLSPGAAAALPELVPAAASLVPEVEAILLQRPRGGGVRCFVAPIDLCFELVGALKREWRGFSGGDRARNEIDAFFARLTS